MNTGFLQHDQFYIYAIAFGSIAASATAQGSVTIQADSNFLWEATTFFASINGGSQPLSDAIERPFAMQVTDSGVARNFFSGSVPVDLFAGTGKFPFVLPDPYLWKAVSTIQATISNLDAATQWNNVTIGFIGKKTYSSHPAG